MRAATPSFEDVFLGSERSSIVNNAALRIDGGLIRDVRETPVQLRPLGFAGTVLLLANRELGARLRSPWLYAVASLICLIAFFYGGGFRRSFETETVLVTTDPLAALNVMVVAVLAGVLGLRLATSTAGNASIARWRSCWRDRFRPK